MMVRLRQWWDGTPIVNKVLICNAGVVFVGAIGGTFLTNMLVNVSGMFLALFYASFGVLFSLIINYHVLNSAMHPMDVLQETVQKIDGGDTAVRAPVDEIGDPQLKAFAQSVNTMLGRLAAHMQIIEKSRAQLRRLSGQVLSAQEEERKRIARELHDDTSGALARVILNLEMCEDSLPADLTVTRERVRSTRVLAEQTLENTRKMIFDLRPTLLDDLGLAAAVRWYAKTSLEPAGINVQFEASPSLGRAAPHVETALFRIAQEAINNIIRHAAAHHAQIQLVREGARWVLRIRDDGCGFDINALARAPEVQGEHHWGLFGIEERVNLLGGALELKSALGKGTTLRVEIPVE